METSVLVGFDDCSIFIEKKGFYFSFRRGQEAVMTPPTSDRLSNTESEVNYESDQFNLRIERAPLACNDVVVNLSF